MEKKAKIYYFRFPSMSNKAEKLELLRSTRIGKIAFERIIPDKKGNWLNEGLQEEFETFIPLCSKDVKLNKSENAIFQSYTNGVSTNRDEWVYDFNKKRLKKKAQFFIKKYNELIKIKSGLWDTSIKWSETLKKHFLNGRKIKFNDSQFSIVTYRPFIKKHYYSDKLLSDRLTQNHYQIFGKELNKINKVITISQGNRANFFTLITKNLPSLDIYLPNAANCLPLFVYDDNNLPQKNITNWALYQFQSHYQDNTITKENIFEYVYAILHHPEYRQKYDLNLKRDFPRIPFYEDFKKWANVGKKLVELHLDYEDISLFPLKIVEVKNLKENPKVKLKANKEIGEIILDENTSLSGIPALAWEYKLGNRSALEWVLDQFKESNSDDINIQDIEPYQFTDYKDFVIDLIMRLCTVSVETMKIIQSKE
jgi:predicted helicase